MWNSTWTCVWADLLYWVAATAKSSGSVAGLMSTQVAVRVCVLGTQLCPTLCDPMDYSLPGSSVHSIFQARIMDWVASASSRGLTHISCFAGRFFTCLIIHRSRICLCQLRWQYMKQMAWPTMRAHTSVFRSPKTSRDGLPWNLGTDWWWW